jgi:hypothetical protein
MAVVVADEGDGVLAVAIDEHGFVVLGDTVVRGARAADGLEALQLATTSIPPYIQQWQ